MLTQAIVRRSTASGKIIKVKTRYQLLGISKQAYYKRLKRMKSIDARDQIVCHLVRARRRMFPRMGTRKILLLIKIDLSSHGIKIGRDKLFEILRKNLLLVPKRRSYQKTTQSLHRFRKHPNLIMGLTINESEQVWVADITYIKTKQGFRYLHLITDAYSKQIMGYELSDNMKIETAILALKRAVRNRKYPERKLIHHSDRGLQYCHDKYINYLKNHKIKVSMTTQYDPYENAIAERVNGILKDEFDIGEGFLDHLQAVKWIKESVELYNHHRPHMSCGMLTPAKAHISNKPLVKCWK